MSDVTRMFERLQREMVESNETLSVAESCTGGLISHRITEVPGASGYFRLGIVAYSNEAKVRLLGVKEDSLVRFGAVSEAVAREMASGVAGIARSDWGVGVTGIAGPAGGTPDKPVGTVFIGVFSSRNSICRVERCDFDGGRSQIKEKTASEAIRYLLSLIGSRG